MNPDPITAFDSRFSGGDISMVFRIEPAKVLAFAKQPHGQTSFRFPK